MPVSSHDATLEAADDALAAGPPLALLWNGWARPSFHWGGNSMNFRTLSYEKLGAVLRITANRPEVLNAQSRVMIVELDEAFRAASDDADTRVTIVAGAGQHFLAGPPP